MNALWLLVFCCMQALAQVIFKYGSTAPPRWLPCFVAGNVFGASSIWFLMLLYKAMNPNVALGLASAGAFLSAQAAVAVVFRSHLSAQQYVAMFAIAIGMWLFTSAHKT
jgi:multidrug transporter EmrE-like cation transporter